MRPSRDQVYNSQWHEARGYVLTENYYKAGTIETTCSRVQFTSISPGPTEIRGTIRSTYFNMHFDFYVIP